jgi:hypothetical protein
MMEHQMNIDSGTLRIERPSGKYRDALRACRILVDGQARGEVRQGEVLELDLAPGRHVVQARLEYTGSPEQVVDVAPGAAVSVVVEPAGSAFALWQALARTSWIRIKVKGGKEDAN